MILWLIFLPAIIFGIALVAMHGGPIALASAAVIFLCYGSVLVAVTRRWLRTRRR
ncbi:MAG: hypothetical protein JWO97_730 [Acidobacteria bacterium]|nr:hypothetical protein [Acidobacteriota bacterium]